MPPSAITDLVYIDAQGYHYADYPTFLNWINAKYQGIYGLDSYVDPDSMDGQFLAILAQAFYDTAALGNAVYNSFSPLTAVGYGLSRNVQINGLQKKEASFSTVGLTIIGVANTPISSGVAQDELGQLWNLPESALIPGGGSLTVTATAATIGAIFAEANTITQIFTPTNGWQTVNNSSSAIPGNPVESDSALRIRQAQSTALPSLTVLEGTKGAIANVPGVSQVEVYENDTNETDGNGIPANSVAAVIAGSFDYTAVAQAIQIKKTPGAGTYGNQTVLVNDSRGMPINIEFTDVAEVSPGAGIKVWIQYVAVNSGPNVFSTDYIPLIQAAVAAVVNVAGIGAVDTNGQINYTTLFAPAYLNGAPEGQSYVISNLSIALNSGSYNSSNIDIAWNQLPVCNPAVDVTVSTSPHP